MHYLSQNSTNKYSIIFFDIYLFCALRYKALKTRKLLFLLILF